MTELTPRTTKELCDLAKQYYNPDVPYHNWSHAEEVMGNMAVIVRDYFGGKNDSARSKRIDLNLGFVAAAHHDNGHDHAEADNFPSKEHYSVALMRRALEGKVSPEQLDELERIILGTRFGVPRTSDLELILHYADVWNMASDYNDFFGHSLKLWDEYGKPRWTDFQANSQRVISATIAESLRSGDFCSRTATLGADPYHFPVRATRNLERFMQEPEPSL